MGRRDFFETTFHALTDNEPFPWQRDLYESWFSKGKFPASCNLPTGLGKTSVVAVWLVALAKGASVPRRLVYVVNRRTVVDQTTDEVLQLRKNLPKLANLPAHVCELKISTLRGQFADNREWSADPSRPAVICGTVDMIGSRLLFSGYGVGFKAKPLHAGFLGQDSLLIHDEAHLEPAFQELLDKIESEQQKGERSEPISWPKLRVMELSATSRKNESGPKKQTTFELTEAEKNPPARIPDPPMEPIHFVWLRLRAKKAVHFHAVGIERGATAKRIATLAADYRDKNNSVLVFVRTLEDVGVVAKELAKTNRPIELLTGTMRGKERDDVVETDNFKRFKGGTGAETVYLVSTSAGEVGIDMSADHLICDLTPLDSMAQRFGRVNRYGNGDARIDVIHPTEFGDEKEQDGYEARRRNTLALLKSEALALPPMDNEPSTKRYDASPLALMTRLDPDRRAAAFTPQPTILPATDILFDAWALTTIREKLPGRPPVEPYLHGIADWQPPETQVAWREDVEVITAELIERYKPKDLSEDLLEDYPLKPHELLRDRSDRVFDELQTISKRLEFDPSIWVIEDDGQVNVTTLGTLLKADKKTVVSRIASCTILLPPTAGGLTDKGMLDGKVACGRERANRYDIADAWFDEQENPRRTRIFSDVAKASPPSGMRLVRTIDADPEADEREEESHSSTGERYWHWYTRPRSADDDLSKTGIEPIKWEHHTKDVTDNVERIVQALDLPVELQRSLVVAAMFHDLGKMREIWQRSIGNPNPKDWHAKSGKQWKSLDICRDYRHEFGSLLDVRHGYNGSPPSQEFLSLTEEQQELVLHLIATHHGYARPHFPAENAEYPDSNHTDSDAKAFAIEVPGRFARLQRKYGRWGLAYLESLLRAADWAASSKPTEAQL